ncbi:hypothetical protein L1787_16715 [Acuticoccus sp. M5D2P5]|uniref:hypothetical protein n=1 Tax=Acuticoccus kalidii TaxID=2910977 RepID=UPI001F238CA3|nr:hypothetical protein [Acuticoccus kalidii]MCF3935048.1 hypothetical protein [Acuticoccus kalidii]
MTVQGHNGFDSEVVQNYIRRHENIASQILSVKGRAMKEIQDLKADQGSVLDEAKDTHGIPKKLLKLILKQREFERKIDELTEDLDDDDGDTYDQMLLAIQGMEDTPLGQAALAGTKSKADDGQTDIEELAKAKASEEGDGEVDAFLDKTHAERVAASAE